VLLLPLLYACGSRVPEPQPRPAAAPSAPATPATTFAASPAPTPTPAAHEHAPPHGGLLVEFGEEFAHLELLLNADTGTLQAFALDGEAERPLRLSQAAIEIDVKPRTGTPFRVKLAPVASALSGEQVGDTSHFAGRSKALEGIGAFEGVVKAVKLKGQDFKDAGFSFPEGKAAIGAKSTPR
jgi:hypothetical protein